MKNQGKYLEEAKWIADLVIDKFSNQHAQIPTRINCNSGEIIDSMEMVDDLGDYVQYIYLLGLLQSTTFCCLSSFVGPLAELTHKFLKR